MFGELTWLSSQLYISIALIAFLLILLRFFLILFRGRAGGLGPVGADGDLVVVVDVVVVAVKIALA